MDEYPAHEKTIPAISGEEFTEIFYLFNLQL